MRESLRVNKVDANVLVLDEQFTLLDLGHGQVGLVLEDVDATGLFDDDAGHGLWNFGSHCGIKICVFGSEIVMIYAGGKNVVGARADERRGVDVAMVVLVRGSGNWRC